jgi:hypothetical protein
MNLISDDSRLNFRKFLLPDESIDGKSKTVMVEFDTELPENASDDEINDFEMRMMEREEEMDNRTKIFKVNPTLFRDLKFKMKISPELIAAPNEALIRQQAIEVYQLTRPDPNFDSQAIARDIVLPAFAQTAEDPDKYLAQAQAQASPFGVLPEGQAESVEVTATEGTEGEPAQAEVEAAQLTV